MDILQDGMEYKYINIIDKINKFNNMNNTNKDNLKNIFNMLFIYNKYPKKITKDDLQKWIKSLSISNILSSNIVVEGKSYKNRLDDEINKHFTDELLNIINDQIIAKIFEGLSSKYDTPSFLDLYRIIKDKLPSNKMDYDSLILLIDQTIPMGNNSIKISFRKNFIKFKEYKTTGYHEYCTFKSTDKIDKNDLEICIEEFQKKYLAKYKIEDILNKIKDILSKNLKNIVINKNNKSLENIPVEVKEAVITDELNKNKKKLIESIPKAFSSYNDDIIELDDFVKVLFKFNERWFSDFRYKTGIFFKKYFDSFKNPESQTMERLLESPIKTLQSYSNKLFKVGEYVRPTEVTEPFSLIPVYRQDVMKRFFQTYLENIEKTKEMVKDKVNISFISEGKKVNKLTKLPREELHRKNMIIYYIIPLVYLVYSYVYIKFNKQQKLRIMYRETKLTYEMYAFLFDRRNPVIKKVNVYFHETFKKEDKIQSVDDKKLLPSINDTKQQMIVFLQFVEQQIIAENDYTAELKRVDDIIAHLEVINGYFKDAQNTETKANTNKKRIIELENKIPAKIRRFETASKPVHKDSYYLNLKKNQRELAKLKQKKFEEGAINTIKNLISDQRNSKLQKKYRKTYDNILDEMQQTNLLLIELDDLESINTSLSDSSTTPNLKDYKLLENNLNNQQITKLITFYNTLKGKIDTKNTSQIESTKNIKKIIEALNSDTELYNDLYKELFSANSKMTPTIRDKYKNLVIQQFNKYFNIINTLLNTNVFKNFTDPKYFVDEYFKLINISTLNPVKYKSNTTENLNIQTLLHIFLNVIIVYKLFETIYLICIIVDEPYKNYLILDNYIKLIKDIQDLFNDKFRDYKTKTVDYSDKINVLEKMRKQITSSLTENQRELKSIESNIIEYSSNNQAKINGKDSNKKDGLVEKIKKVKLSISTLETELTKDDCKKFKDIKQIYPKTFDNLSEAEKQLINSLKSSLRSRVTWSTSKSGVTWSTSKSGDPKDRQNQEILDMYNFLKDIYDKKQDELDKKQRELESLELEKTTLESRISKRASDKRTFSEKISNLNVLATKIDARLMKLQSKNSSFLPNFTLIQQKFTGMFKVTYDITEKYKEYTRTFAFRKSKNKLSFLYDENQKKFNEDYGKILTNIDKLEHKCNTSTSVCTTKNCKDICNSVKKLTDGLIKKMINDKSKNFLTELEKYFKDATPIEKPFFEEYKIHYESMTRQILILLTKINTKELKLKDNTEFKKIKEDYMNHTNNKNKVLNKINKVIKSHITKIQANNNKKIANGSSYNNEKNSSNKPPFIVAPYTYVLFAYFIDLLLIIDYLTFFYE